MSKLFQESAIAELLKQFPIILQTDMSFVLSIRNRYHAFSVFTVKIHRLKTE